jgi:hypothetical protein
MTERKQITPYEPTGRVTFSETWERLPPCHCGGARWKDVYSDKTLCVNCDASTDSRRVELLGKA